jgi:hypothetical protein
MDPVVIPKTVKVPEVPGGIKFGKKLVARKTHSKQQLCAMSAQQNDSFNAKMQSLIV